MRALAWFTDSEISGNKIVHGAERKLQKWDDGGDDSGGLEGFQMEKKGEGNGGSWDQFETNKNLFGVTSTYKEDMYTTKLDMSQLTPEMQARAEALAKSIEGDLDHHVR